MKDDREIKRCPDCGCPTFKPPTSLEEILERRAMRNAYIDMRAGVTDEDIRAWAKEG